MGKKEIIGLRGRGGGGEGCSEASCRVTEEYGRIFVQYRLRIPNRSACINRVRQQCMQGLKDSARHQGKRVFVLNRII